MPRVLGHYGVAAARAREAVVGTESMVRGSPTVDAIATSEMLFVLLGIPRITS